MTPGYRCDIVGTADDVEIDYDAAKDIVDDVAADGVTLEQDVQNAGDDQASYGPSSGAADYSQEGHDHLKQLVEAEVNEQLTAVAFWFSPGGDAQQHEGISALDRSAPADHGSSSGIAARAARAARQITATSGGEDIRIDA